MKTCPACGAENRDSANYCRICRTKLPSAAPQPAISPPQKVVGQAPAVPPAIPAQSIQPTALSPSPAGPQPSPAPPVQAKPPRQAPQAFSGLKFGRHPVVDGRVSAVDPLRDAKLPFDPARFLVALAVILAGMGVCAATAVVALAIFIALAILGAGSLCLLPLILPLLAGLVSWLIYGVRGSRIAPMIDCIVNDELTGQPINVVLYLKEGFGGLRLGERVQVFGHKQRSTRIVRAYQVLVYESNGQPTYHWVRGVRPWPLWVGLSLLAAEIALFVWWLVGAVLP
jgi:hypothetical protein